MYLYKTIKYQLYLLQLENYELGRYFRLLFKQGLFPPKKLRKSLVWTAKAILVFCIAIVFYLVLPFLMWYGFFGRFWELGIRNYELWIFVLLFYSVFLFLFFIFYSLAVIIFWPFDSLVKNLIVARAKSKIRTLTSSSSPKGRGGLTIIGIAGSYGKTTMKEVLKQVLGIRYKVLGTPESVNTPVGIARWILGKVEASTEIIIVEMGEHYAGDIEELCKITRPDIAVVTGINEAHLERMKTMENVIATVFEIAGKAKPGATIVLNGDDQNVVNNYKEFVWPDHKIEKFSSAGWRTNFQFNQEKLGWEAEVEGVGKIFINLLGEYALGDVDAAVKIAQKLGMTSEEIKNGITKIKPVEHRLQPILGQNDVLVIDDSYNGNPQGAAEAIKVLSRFSGRRKIYLTPGLVEMGKAEAEVHREIGRLLAGVADVVILVKNSVTPWIEEGILSVPSRPPSRDPEPRNWIPDQVRNDKGGRPQIIWFNTAPEAHAGLKNILKPGDVILFQNDWGDNYL